MTQRVTTLPDTNNTQHTTHGKEMTYKIIQLTLDALLMHAKVKGNSGDFNRDMDDAIKALKKIVKYF